MLHLVKRKKVKRNKLIEEKGAEMSEK